MEVDSTDGGRPVADIGLRPVANRSSGTTLVLMVARRVLVGVLVLGSLIFSPVAAAKAFRPGDVRLCSAQRCVRIESQPVLDALAAFYYDSGRRPVSVGAPRVGARSFKLEFSNGYVSGVAAGSDLDRFRSGGVNLEQFADGVWYRLPSLVSSGLRRLADALPPDGQGSSLPWIGGVAAALVAIAFAIAAFARRRAVRLPTRARADRAI